ncbi:MAG: hypothetical protein PGN29_08135 [Gordonia paraffinivorans]
MTEPIASPAAAFVPDTTPAIEAPPAAGIPTPPAAEATAPTGGRSRALRQRAQAAEADRNTAIAAADRLRSAEVARLASDRLANPADLTDAALGGVALADLSDPDTGLIDPQRVDDAVAAVLAVRPGLATAKLRTPAPGTYAQGGQFGSPPATVTQPKATWSAAFRRD